VRFGRARDGGSLRMGQFSSSHEHAASFRKYAGDYDKLQEDAAGQREMVRLMEKQPMYAIRVQRLQLDDAQKDFVAYVMQKARNYMNKGDAWKQHGDRLYALQITASAVVPVLIGIIGSFDSAIVDLLIRVGAIILSVAATVCAAIESVYMFRMRGQVRRGFGDQLNDLFQAFETLSGPLFSPGLPERVPAEPATITKLRTTYTLPDLTGIPRAVLLAHLDHLDAIEASTNAAAAKPVATSTTADPVAAVPRHAEIFRLFANEAIRINTAARAAAFVGQDVSAGQSASRDVAAPAPPDAYASASSVPAGRGGAASEPAAHRERSLLNA